MRPPRLASFPAPRGGSGLGRGLRAAALGLLGVAATSLMLPACSGTSGSNGGNDGGASVPPPDDPMFPAQWNLHQIGIPEAWRVTRGGGVTVAVLDTGVAFEDDGEYRKAPDLAGTRFVAGWDFVDNDSHPNDEPMADRPTHGTHMTGTIAQTTNNRLGAAGVAPDVTIMPIRVLTPDGNGTGANIAQGLRFAADHGAQIANLSLGSRDDDPQVAEATRYAIDKGVTVIAAIGDDGAPSATFPAAYAGVIAVGATRPDRTRAAYSNFGPRLDLVAPGGDRQADHNHDGLEDGIVQQSVYQQKNSFCFCFIEGTSSATAHVSATAALIVSAGRAAAPAEVRKVLMSTAEDLGPPGRDDEYGAGMVQAARAVAAGR